MKIRLLLILLMSFSFLMSKSIIGPQVVWAQSDDDEEEEDEDEFAGDDDEDDDFEEEEDEEEEDEEDEDDEDEEDEDDEDFDDDEEDEDFDDDEEDEDFDDDEEDDSADLEDDDFDDDEGEDDEVNADIDDEDFDDDDFEDIEDEGDDELNADADLEDEVDPDIEDESDEVLADVVEDEGEIDSTQEQEEFGENVEFANDSIADDPDVNLERRLYEIYENYNKAAISESEWSEITRESETESYPIQVGDTLWGISEMLFGDGNYWPKVWSFNASITNPHVIEVGDVINFVEGDEESEPTITIEQDAEGEASDGEMIQAEDGEGSESDANAENVADNMEESTEEPILPDASSPKRPVLQFLPPSLPRDTISSIKYNQAEFTISGKRKSVNAEAKMLVPTFFAEEYPESLGKVSEVEGDRQSAGLYEYVYVTLDDGNVGDNYTVISKEGSATGNKVAIDSAGQSIDYQGEITLEELVNEDEGLYRAQITKQVNPVYVGGEVIEGEIPEVTVSLKGRTSDVQANIVGGEFDSNRKLLGTGAVVYLDAGGSDGVEPGDIVSVVANEQLRNSRTQITKNTRVIGKVKVVKAEDSVSTGVIVYASNPVSTGDFTGIVAVSEISTEDDDLDIDDDDSADEFEDEAEGDSEDLSDEEEEFSDEEETGDSDDGLDEEFEDEDEEEEF